MSKSRGNVVDPWEVIDAHGADAFRWYYLDRPAALGRLPLLGRHGRRVGAPVPAHALEHLLLLGPLRERRGPRPGRPPAAAGSRTRPAAASSTAGRSRACRRRSATVRERAGRLRLHHRRAAIADFVEELSNWYVRALAPPLLGGRPRRLRDPAPLPASETAKLLAPFTPFLADEIYLEPRRRRAELGEPTTRSTCATSRSRTRRSPTPSSRPGWRRSGARSSSAAPPAPRRR